MYLLCHLRSQIQQEAYWVPVSTGEKSFCSFDIFTGTPRIKQRSEILLNLDYRYKAYITELFLLQVTSQKPQFQLV